MNNNSGAILVLSGPSGAGKSTIFELILKNLKAKNGIINSVTSISQVYQDPYSSFHPSYSLLHQIQDVASTEKIYEYIKSLNLDYNLLNKLPHELSGGQLQRASILRSMLMEPELLLLDEPTSALDPIAAAKVEELILELKKDYTIIMVTHSMQQAARISDYTAFFYEGELIEYDKTTKIFNYCSWLFSSIKSES